MSYIVCCCDRCTSNLQSMQKLKCKADEKISYDKESLFNLKCDIESSRDIVRYLLLSLSPCSSYSYGIGTLHRIHLNLLHHEMVEGGSNLDKFDLYNNDFLDMLNQESNSLYGITYVMYDESLYVKSETIGECLYVHRMTYFYKEFGIIFAVFFVLGFITIPCYIIWFLSLIFDKKVSFEIRDILRINHV